MICRIITWLMFSKKKNINKINKWYFAIPLIEGMKVQVVQKSELYSMTNKIKNVALKIDKTCIFLGLLPKCMIIFKADRCIHANSIPKRYVYIYTSPHDWYPTYKTSLQVISKICTNFAGDWWKRKWFCRELIKSKHNTLFPK